MDEQPATDSPSTLDVTRLQRQDAREFTALVAELEPMVTGLCRAMGLRGADLEDAAAEAFGEIYRSLPGFRGQSAVRTWAYRIAMRVVWRIKATIRKSRHSEFVEAAMPSPSAAPDKLAQCRQESEQIWNAVSELEPRQATVVELFYRQDRSIESIADMMDCPVATVKTWLHRARQILKTKLDPGAS